MNRNFMFRSLKYLNYGTFYQSRYCSAEKAHSVSESIRKVIFRGAFFNGRIFERLQFVISYSSANSDSEHRSAGRNQHPDYGGKDAEAQKSRRIKNTGTG